MEVPRRKKTQVVCALIENVAGRVFVAKRPEGKSLGDIGNSRAEK